MKSRLFQFPILLTCLALAFNGYGQVTLTSGNFVRGTTFSDSIVLASQTGIALPAEGAAQTWDYSALTMGSLTVRDHFDASSDPNFAGARNFYSNDLTFQGFLIMATSYEAIDNNGWYEMGRSIEGVTYSIASISGGANDSLSFVGQNDLYAGRMNLLNFPTTYQDQWTQSYAEVTDFELTVAAFSLNKTPGYQQRIITQDREVVGYGTLKIPTGNSSAPTALPALLIKAQRTLVDSFFVGGMVAPSALTGAFGLTQGATFSDEFYVFYTPGYGSPVMSMDITNGMGENAAYRTGANKATFSLGENLTFKANFYPNPVKDGQALTIELEDQVGTAVFTVMDINGRELYRQTLEPSGKTFRYEIPTSLSAGMYLFRLEDTDGSHFNGKFQKVK